LQAPLRHIVPKDAGNKLSEQRLGHRTRGRPRPPAPERTTRKVAPGLGPNARVWVGAVLRRDGTVAALPFKLAPSCTATQGLPGVTDRSRGMSGNALTAETNRGPYMVKALGALACLVLEAAIASTADFHDLPSLDRWYAMVLIG